jgi:hypothetical protein
MNASPIKLRNGTWGAKVVTKGALPADGASVIITTRAGKSWTARIRRVVWSSADRKVHYCATESLDRSDERPIEIRIGGHRYTRNASGQRCEDAPCCGCCSI